MICSKFHVILSIVYGIHVSYETVNDNTITPILGDSALLWFIAVQLRKHYFTQQIGVHEAPPCDCFTCARNISFQHKIKFCVDVERIVCFPCVRLCFVCASFKIKHKNIGFVCVYFEFTLLSSTW